MRIEDTKLVIIKSENSYTAYLDRMRGIIVQTETLDEIPKKIAEALILFLEYGMNINEHTPTGEFNEYTNCKTGIHEFHDLTDLLSIK